MNRQSGIALVTSLFILVAVMLIGLGSIFLTRTNLKVSENIRSNAVARNNAESGVEAVYLLLSSHHDTYSTFPTDQNSISLPAGSGYTLSSYRFDSADQAMIRIRGSSAQGAEHESEVLLNLFTPPPEIPEAYATGLVSEGEIRVTSNASIYIDAGVHGNAGFDLGGTFYECTARDASGNCTTMVAIDASTLPISLSDPTGTCKIGSGPSCDPADYMGESVSVNPDYIARRDAAMAAEDLDADDDWDAADCALAGTTLSPAMTGQVVCSSGNLSVTNPLWSDVTVITSGDITLSGTAFLDNVTLISTGGLVSINAGTMEETRIFSEDSLSYTGNNASYTWNGSNTIATAGDITFNGSNKHSNVVNTTVNAEGIKEVGMVLIAEGDITFNGRNSTNQDYYAVFVSGGEFTQNGRSDLYGAISSVGDLRFNGNFFVDSAFEITNDDLAEEQPPEVAVLSRR